MYVALRPYMTAGVALAGAAAIAVSPVSPVTDSLSEIAAPVTHAANVELTSIQDGIAAYLRLFENTTGSLVNLFNEAVIDNGPAPILQAILENQFTIAAGLANGLVDSAESVLQQFANIPTVIEVVTGLLASGNVQGAATTLVDAFNIGVIQIIAPLLGPLTAAITTPINHFAEAVTAVADQGLLLAGLALLSAPASLIVSSGAAAQGIVDAFESGDIGNIIGAFIAAPAVVADGVLNGFTANYPGLLSDFGPFGALLQIRNIIANAISPAPAVTPFSAGPESVPETGRVFSFSTTGGSVGVLDDQSEQAAAGDTAAVDATAPSDVTAGDDVTGDDATAGDDETAGDDVTADDTTGDDVAAVEDDTATDDVAGDDDTAANDVTGDDSTDADAGTDTTADAGADANTGGTDDSGSDNTGGTDTSGANDTATD